MTWTFTPGAPADARRALPVFTFTPNWSGGVLERLAWLTDVMSSERAVEQRRSIRLSPRRSFEASFMRTRAQRTRLDLFLAGVGKGVMLVPLWHEQFRIGAPIAGADLSNGTPIQFPAGTLKQREFGVGDLVLLMLKGPEKYAILTVMSANPVNDRITVRSSGNIGEWSDQTRITPLRRARIMDSPSIDNLTDRVGTAQIRFDLTDADDRFVPSWGYCSPLFRFKPDRINPIKDTYGRSVYTVDFDSGVMDVEDLTNRARISSSLTLKLFGRDNAVDFRSFLYMARGRAVRFYVPSFTEDLVLERDVEYGPTFVAENTGFVSNMPVPQESRRIVSFEFNDGRPTIYRNVIGVQAEFSPVAPFEQIGERFTVTPNMPPVLMNDVKRISFVVPSRFDQDGFELFHYVDDSAAVGAAFVVTSDVVDGMPPIECWVTSRPYPVVAVEEMSALGRLTGGRIYEPGFATREDMTVSAVLTGGTLTSALSRYEIPPDSMTVGGVLSGGTLRTTLRDYTVTPPDEVTSQAKLTSGTMKVVLIRQPVPIESMTPSAILTGGTLT